MRISSNSSCTWPAAPLSRWMPAVRERRYKTQRKDTPLRASFLPLPLHNSSSAAGKALHGALFQATLCVSATYCHNLCRKAKSSDMRYQKKAKQYRVDALNLLQQSFGSATGPAVHDANSKQVESRSATAILLILAAVSILTPRGVVWSADSRRSLTATPPWCPLFLETARWICCYAVRMRHLFSSEWKVQGTPTHRSAALHSIYRVFDGVCRQQTVETSSIVWSRLAHDPTCNRREKLYIQMIAGAVSG